MDSGDASSWRYSTPKSVGPIKRAADNAAETKGKKRGEMI